MALQPLPVTAEAGHGADWQELSVLTTCLDSPEDAAALARQLVAARVAACVQVQAIESHYSWQGQQEQAGEWRLVCKTLPAALPALVAVLRQAHSYAVPQITVRQEWCLADYGAWVAAQVDGTKP